MLGACPDPACQLKHLQFATPALRARRQTKPPQRSPWGQPVPLSSAPAFFALGTYLRSRGPAHDFTASELGEKQRPPHTCENR